MKCLIIGGDAAGMTAASQIRRRRPDWNVTVLEKGRYASYGACGIPYFLAGDIERLEDLVVITPDEIREKRGIDIRMGWEAESLDVDNKTVQARSREGNTVSLAYDRLLVATGASPITPPWSGRDLDGVAVVRNLEDAARVLALLDLRPSRCAIIGAGYVGLEMAEALGRRGLNTVVVEKLDSVMGGADSKITELVRDEMDRHGIELRLGTTVGGFTGESRRLRAVETDGGAIQADLALISLGVRPNIALARAAGVPLGETGAIRVDDRQLSGSPWVYAAGDCAEAYHRVLGKPAYIPLALTANRAGRVAGANMAGGDERFPGVVGSAVTRVFDLVLARTGIDERTAEREGIPVDITTVTAGSRAHYFPGHAPVWVKMLSRADNGRVVGALLAGKDESLGKRCDVFATAISAGLSVDEVADLDLCYAPPFAPVWDPVLQAANRARFARHGSA